MYSWLSRDREWLAEEDEEVVVVVVLLLYMSATGTGAGPGTKLARLESASVGGKP